jgi:Protein of unknown function (DUF3147)
MSVTFEPSALKRTKWWEVGIRFAFGGSITVVAGLLAKKFGPGFGGLFLAFPAIFPASATLIERHERDKKRDAGIAETVRGRRAAALDARGACLGGVGLATFALLTWKMLPNWNAALTLAVALAAWIGVSVTLWCIQRQL